MSKVKIIAHPETGKMFTETSNPDFVKCQLQTQELVVNGGVISFQKRVAFPALNVNTIEALKGLKSGDIFPLEGKITRKITSIPQFEGHQKVKNPTTGEEMDYYQTFEFTTNLHATDEDLRNVEVGKEVVISSKMPANTAFEDE